MNFILHIGFSKTGTTAIQSFLSDNRKQLAKKGILYPDFRYKGFMTGFLNHNLLVNNIVGKTGWFRLSPQRCLAQITSHQKKNPSIDTVLLSGESFAGMPHI